MRAFIAVEFSRELKGMIARLQNELRGHALSGRWKHADNFHLTLKFLGEIDLKRATLLGGLLQSACAAQKAFDLKISRAGTFPGRDNVRVLWLGMEGDTASLGELRRNIEEELEIAGFPRENRSFKPHITIGQELLFNTDLETLMRKIDVSAFPAVHVDGVVLYKSEQIGKRRVYTPIRKFPFEAG